MVSCVVCACFRRMNLSNVETKKACSVPEPHFTATADNQSVTRGALLMPLPNWNFVELTCSL